MGFDSDTSVSRSSCGQVFIGALVSLQWNRRIFEWRSFIAARRSRFRYCVSL